MAKTTLECAERNGMLSSEQCRSRKYIRVISQVCNKRLLYYLNHMQRRSIVLCSNDAKSCYDKMVHSIASLAVQRVGMPRAHVVSMFRTTQGKKCCMRTAFGDSSITINGRDFGKPHQGTLRINGSSPVTWVLSNASMVGA